MGVDSVRIVEVLKLVSTLGVRSVTFGLPILLEEAVAGVTDNRSRGWH